MNELTIVLTLIIAFLGILMGVVLAFIAPEELKAGRRYFKWLKTIILLLMIAVMLYFRINYFMIALNVFLLALFYMYDREYWILCFLLLMSNVNNAAFFIQSSLIFIYGLPEGTLFAEKIIKKKKSEIVLSAFRRYNWFLVFGIIILLINAYA